MIRPIVVVPVLVVGVLLAGIAAYLFQPWKLWVDDVVNQDLPATASAPPAADAGRRGSPRPRIGLRALASGRLVSHEHATSGTVRVLQLPHGARVLRLENLDTSNGPDLRVWVTDAPVITEREGWFLFDDGRHVDLGPLKGNIGNQNYPLPAAVDLSRLRSVSIWCDRFNVSFGAAALGRHPGDSSWRPVTERPLPETEP